MISMVVFNIPLGLWIFLGLIVVVIGILVLYALHSKGDVRAVFAHGRTMFTLEAKSRESRRS